MLAKIFIGLVLVCACFRASQATPLDEQDCPQICPDNYEPVCGTDGKNFLEFANQCEFETRNCLSQKASFKRKFKLHFI